MAFEGQSIEIGIWTHNEAASGNPRNHAGLPAHLLVRMPASNINALIDVLPQIHRHPLEAMEPKEPCNIENSNRPGLVVKPRRHPGLRPDTTDRPPRNTREPPHHANRHPTSALQLHAPLARAHHLRPSNLTHHRLDRSRAPILQAFAKELRRACFVAVRRLWVRGYAAGVFLDCVQLETRHQAHGV